MDKFVSVIIPVLNNIDGLCKTLLALDSQTYPKELYEVIVVDNGSEQDLQPIVLQFNQVKLTCERRSGSYVARNRGINQAKGEILAFTDSDCIPSEDWIANGVAGLLSVANCGLVAGKINFFYQNPQKPTPVELYDSTTFLNQEKYIEQHHYGATANMFTWKSVVEKVGNFNENLKSGGDKEWGQRVYHYGYQLVYGSDACIAHPARYSWQEIAKKIARTRTGGNNLNILSADNVWKLNWQRITRIIWLLKPPTKSVLSKLNNCKDTVNWSQKFQLVSMAIALHYYGVWSDIKFYFQAK